MFVTVILGLLASLSLALTLWQWWEGRRFPLHQRAAKRGTGPALTVLKPLKGCDTETFECLRGWLAQEYSSPVQVLFGVAAADDPVCGVVRELLSQFPQADAQLLVCPQAMGPNAKVSTLAQLEPHAKHDLLVVSDADVRTPPGFLAELTQYFQDPAVGLVNPFYRLANPSTPAMQWEALAVNADFWTSVLQSQRLEPLAFALGAVMAVRRVHVRKMGGFEALADYLADDYELGRRVAGQGSRIVLCPVVVECWEAPQGWRAIWRHQLRWARTIRVCRPGSYALSVLSNATLWPIVWLAAAPGRLTAIAAGLCLLTRLGTACSSQHRVTRSWSHMPWLWMAPIKDLLQFLVWAISFAGNTVEWRGERLRVKPGGRLDRNVDPRLGQPSLGQSPP